MKNAKHIKVAPGIIYIFVISPKIWELIFWSLKYVYLKYTFFGPRSKPGPQPNTASYGVTIKFKYFQLIYPDCGVSNTPMKVSLIQTIGRYSSTWPCGRVPFEPVSWAVLLADTGLSVQKEPELRRNSKLFGLQKASTMFLLKVVKVLLVTLGKTYLLPAPPSGMIP